MHTSVHIADAESGETLRDFTIGNGGTKILDGTIADTSDRLAVYSMFTGGFKVYGVPPELVGVFTEPHVDTEKYRDGLYGPTDSAVYQARANGVDQLVRIHFVLEDGEGPPCNREPTPLVST